jgi:hypothetical protein
MDNLAKIAVLRAALAPFAAFAAAYLEKATCEDSTARDTDIVYRLNDVQITFADLRRAIVAEALGEEL